MIFYQLDGMMVMHADPCRKAERRLQLADQPVIGETACTEIILDQ